MRMRAPRVLIWVLLMASPSLLGLALIPAEGRTQGNEDSTHDLIRQLASPDFKQREKAAKLLAERKDATAALKEALKSSDLEIATRAASILKERARRQEL